MEELCFRCVLSAEKSKSFEVNHIYPQLSFTSKKSRDSVTSNVQTPSAYRLKSISTSFRHVAEHRRHKRRRRRRRQKVFEYEMKYDVHLLRREGIGFCLHGDLQNPQTSPPRPTRWRVNFGPRPLKDCAGGLITIKKF